MPVNLNFDGNALVKWVARPVALRAESYAKDAKRRKLIAMAKDCATNLKIADWDVVVWPPERVTMGLIDVLRSTRECRSVSGCAHVAAQLCGKDHPSHPATQLVFRYFCWEFDFPLPVADGTDSIEASTRMFLEFVGDDNVGCVINVLMASEPLKARGSALFPLWTIYPVVRPLPFKWAGSILAMYRKEWESTLTGFADSKARIEDPSFELDGLFESRLNWCKIGLSLLDVLVTSKIARKMEMDILARTENTNRLYLPPFPEKTPVETRECWWNLRPQEKGRFKGRKWSGVMFDVASQFIFYSLMREYHHFVTELLRKRSSVGKRTNRLLLRSKHVFGKTTASDNACVWEAFENSFTDCAVDIRDSASDIDDEEVDLLSSMCKVLGGDQCPTSNIQLSIVDKMLGVDEVEKESFLGRISRRHVRLLHCGNDRALVIPYLSKIILKLSDDRWVRDNDVRALQPFAGIYNEAAIRRAANVVLAMGYQKGIGGFVNEMALRVLKQYARKGELYSVELRDYLLSMLVVKDRVCIRALTTWARDVFGKDYRMVAGLVREMIHDRLFCKSDFGPDRLSNKKEVYYENDAFYDAVYLRRNYAVRNNVDWGPGVPVTGITVVGSTEKGDMGGLEVNGVICALTGPGVQELTLWDSSVISFVKSDVDKSSMFLSDPEWSEQQLHGLPKTVEDSKINFYLSHDVKVGCYCPTLVTKRKPKTKPLPP